MRIKSISPTDAEALLQALRNVTREYMRVMASVHECDVTETRNIVCVDTALRLMKKHDFKQDNPL